MQRKALEIIGAEHEGDNGKSGRGVEIRQPGVDSVEPEHPCESSRVGLTKVERMQVSDAGRAKIIEREGVRLKPYLDTVGIPTIGMGNTTYPDGRKVTMADPPITRAQADAMFRATLDRFAAGVSAALTRTPSQAQFDAMVSFAYNIGLGGFQRSSVLMKFNAGDIQGAAKAFDLYHIPPEIVGRRNGERMQFLNGSDVSAPKVNAESADRRAESAESADRHSPAIGKLLAFLWNFIMSFFRRKS